MRRKLAAGLPLAPIYRYSTQVVDVHDGDTIHAMVDLGFSTFVQVKLRLAGINAPELTQPRGTESRDYLEGLIAGQPLIADTIKMDKYGGRWDAQLYRQSDGLSVNTDMVSSGHAVPYEV